ncbi:MAG TPA: fluoride efflux transporter CrcB [Abditibacteriaceae bacterium]|jgi:CrcB protein
MREILLVGMGGFIGSVLRFKIGSLALHSFGPRLPIGTLIVNLVGCFIIGYLTGLIEKRNLLNPEIRLLLITGFLGGFTTFSAFGLDTLSLLRRARLPMALLNVGVSVLGGLFMVWLGLKVAGALSSKL